jgi:hypothetical protein
MTKRTRQIIGLLSSGRHDHGIAALRSPGRCLLFLRPQLRPAAGRYSGYSVGSAGDVNGDGFADLIVGSSGGNAAYLVFGRASGCAASLDLSSLDGTFLDL